MTKRNAVKRGDKETPSGFSDYINNLQQELQSLDQGLRIGDPAKAKEAASWCTKNLEFINKALYDCRKTGKSTIVSSLEYYKNRISEIEQKYLVLPKLDQTPNTRTLSESRRT